LLRAIIFDFDGILVNSEPLILKLFQEMAAKEGWALEAEDYYRRYLALDDRGVVERLYRSHGRELDPAQLDKLVAWKARAYQKAIRDGVASFPGAKEFVLKASGRFPLAIASGSLRVEVEYLLNKLGLREKFVALATAEDCKRSKPDPEVYMKALRSLELQPSFRERPLRAAECLAIEDASGGIEAAHAAGMKCLALTHTRRAHELRHADWVFDRFAAVHLAQIETAFQ